MSRLLTLDERSGSLFRAYLHPAMTSLNPAGGEGQEIDLPDSQATSGLEAIVARETLLTALVERSRDELNICPTPDLVKNRGTALEEWLHLRYTGQP